MQTADTHASPNTPTYTTLIAISLWPLSVTVLFIALNQFLTTGAVPEFVYGAWALGVLAYWSFAVAGTRLVRAHFAPDHPTRMPVVIQTLLVAGAVCYTLVFLLVALGPAG